MQNDADGLLLTRYRFNAGASGQITGIITDPANGDPVEASTLQSATLTLYDLASFVPDSSPVEGAINARDRQDILGTGSPLGDRDVTYGTGGVFTWAVQPADNVIVTPRRQIERHRAVFTFDWDGGSSVQEFEIEVVHVRP